MFSMIELTKRNFGQVCKLEDYIEETYFEVDYEGNGSFYEVHNLSGKTEVKRFKFSMFELIHIVSILDRETSFKDYKSGCDGDVWEINYYNRKGKLIKTFEGYIYGKEKIEKVISLLYNQVK